MPRPTKRKTGLSTKQRFGWLPDLPDVRDHRYAAATRTRLPATVRLDQAANMPPVYDQGRLGSCTGNALAAAVEFDLRAQNLADFTPSRLFIYYNERVIENSVAQDSGAMIRDGAKTLHNQGVCSESTWPYDVSQFAATPPAAAYAEAKKTITTDYARVDRRHARHVLAAGKPFTIGFSVYQSFETIGADGIMPLPQPGEALLGGHAVLVCGYDVDVNGQGMHYRVRNSWGSGWGDGGYFWMPSQVLTDPGSSSDFWVLNTVS